MSARAGRGPSRRRATGQARRPGRPVRTRVRGSLPSFGRIVAIFAFAGLVVGSVMLANGPWLRVERVASAGARFTTPGELDALLSPYRGAALLTLDSRALEERLRQLPAVSDARVSAQLPNRLSVKVTEKPATMTWLTAGWRLLLAADGTVIARQPRDAEPPAELAALPLVDDHRSSSRRLGVGSSLPAAEIRAVGRLLEIEPRLLGSDAPSFTLQVSEEYGFVLVSGQPAWQLALGFYQLDPAESEGDAIARLEAQVAAVRTLFAEQAEASIRWVDARNPGKVYWAR